MARSDSMRLKLHTGEIGDARRAWHEISLIRPDAVQHGIGLAQDSDILQSYSQMGIKTNVCPASNISLSLADSYRSHPIRKMLSSGVKVTVATDDLTVFGRSLSEEYLELYKAGVSVEELEKMRLNSIEALS